MKFIYNIFRNKKECSKNHQLLVDISILFQKDAGTGIQRVVRALSEQLLTADLEGYQLRFVAATRRRRYRYLDRHGVDRNSLCLGKRVNVERGDIFLGLDLCIRILPRHKRQIRAWKKLGVRICIVVYDLLPIEKSEWFTKNLVTEFAKWLHFVGHHADQALCISRSVTESLEQWLQQEQISRADRVDVCAFPLGGDLRKSQPSAGVSAEEEHALNLLKGCQFVLTVGTIEPRKGHAAALDAFDLLFEEAAKDIPAFVIVGRPGWNTDHLQERMRQHPQRGKKFFWFDDASDELLDRLYQDCAGVLFPTFAEGFGLPVVEALTYNRPVLVRDISVFRELEMPLVSYFEDDTPAALAQAILDWLKHKAWEQRGHQHEIFTWKKSCDGLLRHLKISTRCQN